jgi:hypothetical protein
MTLKKVVLQPATDKVEFKDTVVNMVYLSDEIDLVYTRLLRCDNGGDRQTQDVPYNSPYPIWTNGSYYYKVISQQDTAYEYNLVSSLYSTSLSDCPGFTTTTTTFVGTTTTTTFVGTTTTTTIISCSAPVITNVAFAYQSGSYYYYNVYFTGGDTNCSSITIYYWNGSSWINNTGVCASPRLIPTSIPDGSCLQVKAKKNCSVGGTSPDSNTYLISCTTTTSTTCHDYYYGYISTGTYAGITATCEGQVTTTVYSSTLISEDSEIYYNCELTNPVVPGHYYKLSLIGGDYAIEVISPNGRIWTMTDCSTLVTTTTTTQAPCTLTLLGYDSTTGNLACDDFYNSPHYLRIDSVNFSTATKIYSDSGCTKYANNGYYSNGEIYRQCTSGILGVASSCPDRIIVYCDDPLTALYNGSDTQRITPVIVGTAIGDCSTFGSMTYDYSHPSDINNVRFQLEFDGKIVMDETINQITQHRYFGASWYKNTSTSTAYLHITIDPDTTGDLHIGFSLLCPRLKTGVVIYIRKSGYIQYEDSHQVLHVDWYEAFTYHNSYVIDCFVFSTLHAGPPMIDYATYTIIDYGTDVYEC